MKKAVHQLFMSVAGIVSNSVNNNTSYMKKSLLLAIFVLLVSVNSVFATIYYYQSGTFTTAGSWYSTRGGTGGAAATVFTNSADIFIVQGTGATTNGNGTGASNQTITASSTWTVAGTVEVEGGATINMTSKLTIANIIVDGNSTSYGTIAASSSGYFASSGTTTCNGVMTLNNSGSNSSFGTLTINGNNASSLVSANAKSFTVTTLNVNSGGTLTLTGASNITVSGTTTCNGTMNLTNTSNASFSILNGNGNIYNGWATATSKSFTVSTVASSTFLNSTSGGSVYYKNISSSFTLLSSYNNVSVDDYGAGLTYTPATTTTILGNLVLANNATANIFKLGAVGLTINGNLTIGTNATYASATFASTVKGNVIHNGLASTGTGALTLGGSSAQTISGTGTFAALTLSNSGNISLTSNVSVAGVLDLNSQILNVGANTLTLGTAATISNAGATAYFKVDGTAGKVIKQGSGALTAFLVPMGIGSSYLPVTLTTGATTNVTNQPLSGAHSPATSGTQIGEYWKITSSAATTVAPTFGFPDAITPASNIGSYYRSSAWTTTSTNPTGSSSPYSIAFSALTYTAAEAIDYTVERGCTPPTALTVSGTAAICSSGASTNVTLTSAQSGVSYDLYKGGVLQASTTQTGTGADLTWSVSATGTYTVKSTTSGGYCANFMTGSAVITNKINVGITSVTATYSTLCASATQTLTPNGVAGTNSTTTWYSATGGTGSNYGASATLTAGPGTYYARVTGDCGTPAEAFLTVSTTPAPSITAESLSGATYTQGDVAASISVTASNATGYQWFSNSSASNSGGQSINLATNNTYTPLTTVVAPTYYYCVVSGCSPAATSSVSGLIDVQAPASPTVLTDQTGFSGTFGNQLITSPSSERTFVASGSHLQGDISISAPSGFEISTTSGSGFSNSLNLTNGSGTVNNTTIYVRFAPSGLTTYSGNITLSSTNATDVNIALTGTGIQPSVTPSSVADINFSVTGWTTSTNSSITLNGSNLLGDVTATVVAPFQVSLNGSSGWGTTVSYTNSGTLTAASLYIRYNPSAGTSSNGTDASSLTIASTSLSNIVINLTGKAAPTITPTSIATQYDVTGTVITNILVTVNGGVSSSSTSGLPTGVSGSLSSGVYTISGTPTVAGKYIYTLTINGPTGTTAATTTDTMYVADANKKIAFLYTGTVAKGSNKMYTELAKYFKVDTLIASNTASDTVGTSTYMTNLKSNYNLIVMHEVVGSGTLTYLALGKLVGTLPILNTKVFEYGKANWPAGSGNNGVTGDVNIHLKSTSYYSNHPLFNGVTIVGDSVTMENAGGIVRYLTGATTTNQRVIAYNHSASASNISILEDSVPYTKKEKYMMIALSASQEDLTANGLKVLSNACNYLMGKTVFATTSANGTISPIGESLYEKNASQTYTFTPNAGYQLDSVYVDSIYNAGAVAAGFYTFSNLTANHIIRATYIMTPCPVATINTQPSTAGESVCLNTSATPLAVSVTGTSTVTYQWYSNTTASKIGGSLLTGANTDTYNPVTSVNDTLYYFCVITNTCPAGNFGKDTSTVSGSIKVHSVRGGTLSSNQTICPNTTPASLTLNGSVGTVSKWQYSTDNFVSDINDINVTTLTLNGATIGSLTATTYFRAVLSDCSNTANSTVATVTVTNASAGTVSADQAICSGTAPAALSVTGATGTIQWQSSSDNFVADSTNIGGATNATYTPAALTQVTYYRAKVSTPCATEYSATITVSINSLPSTPTGAVGDARCGAGTVNLSVDNPGAGYAIDWYSTSTGGSASYTGVTYSPSIVANTTYYTAVRNTTTGCSSLPRLAVAGSLQTTTISLTSNGSTTSQNVSAGAALTDITYSLGGTATTATVEWTGTASSSTAPDGVFVNVASSVVTVSGSSLTAGTYGYTLITDGCTPANASGTITTKLATPTISAATSITATGFTANWTGVSDAVSYSIKVYNGATLAATLNGATGVSAAVTGLTTATTYTYTVTAIGNGGNIPNSVASSASASFTTLNTACSITAFTIAGQVSSSIGSNTITVTMPSGTNRFALSPSITLSSGATVSPNTGVSQDLRTSKVYTVTAQDGTTQKTYTVTVSNSPCTATLDLSSGTYFDLGSGSPRYYDSVAGVGRIFKNATGSSTFSISTIVAGQCASYGTKFFTSGSSTFAFQTYKAISKFILYGSGTGTGRTLSTVQVGTTTSNYAAITATATGSGDNQFTTQDVCDTMTIVPASSIAANSYVLLTFSGNINLYKIDYTLVGCVVPQLLTTPTINSSAVTNQGFTANWADVANEIGYTVKVYNASNTLVQTVSNIPANSTSAVITGLSSNTNYTFTVTAVGDGDAYINSNESAKSSAIRTLSTLKDIATFTIAGVTATVGANTVTATVPFSTNLSSLTPVVTVSTNASYSPLTAQDFNADAVYTVTAEDGSTKDYTVTISKAAASSATVMSAYSITGQVSSAISGTNISVVMPYGTADVTALVPHFTLSTYATASPDSAIATDFTNPVVYTVTAEDGLTTQQYTVTVTNASQPSITPSSYSALTFNTAGWTASASQSITLNGANLSTNVVATVAAPYQVSLNGSTNWSTSVSYTPTSGIVTAAPLYVRYNPASGTGADNGTLTLSSTDASDVLITLNGISSPVITLSSGAAKTYVKSGVSMTDDVYNITGGVTAVNVSGLPTGVSYNYSNGVLTISGTPTTTQYQAYPFTISVDGAIGATSASRIDTVVVFKNNLAFLYTSLTPPTGTNKLYTSLLANAKYHINVIVASNTASDTAANTAYMTNIKSNDLIVLHENVNSANLTARALGRLIGVKPILNTKAHMYGVANWPAGSGTNGANYDTTIKIIDGFNNHPMFAGVTINVSDSNKATLCGPAGIIRHAGGVTYGSGVEAIARNRANATSAIIENNNNTATDANKYLLIAMSAGQEDFNSNGLLLYNNACDYLLNSSVYLPVFAYTVSGTAMICAGSDTVVRLSNSQSGVTYQLYKDGVASGSTVTGTGSALTWRVSDAGVYTVQSVTTGNYIANTMTGSATISINPSAVVTPSVVISTLTTNVCASSRVTVTATPTNGGNAPTYNFKVNGTSLQNTTSNTFVTPALNDGDIVTVVMTAHNTCQTANTATSNTLTFTYNVAGTSVWTGNVNTDFATTGNWCSNVVPTSGDLIINTVTSGNYPVFSGTASFNSLTLASGTTFGLGTGSLTITGAISGSGLLVGSSTSSLTLNSSTDNTLNFKTVSTTDNQIGSLTLSGSGKVSLGTNLGITTKLDLNNASSVLDINGHNLTLKSNAAVTAEVAQMNGSIIDGTKASPYTATNVTVERFIPKGKRNYRDLGPSVANAGSVFANWQENGYGSSSYTYGIFITGKFGAPGYSNYSPKFGFDYTTNGNTTPSLYSCNNGIWKAIDSTVSNPVGGIVLGTKGWNLDPFQGLRALVRGARNFNMGTNPASMPTATTIRATGTLVKGTVTFHSISNGGTSTSSITSSFGLTNNGGWSFVANPYACPISWALILANTGTGVNTGLNNTYYFLDPTYQDATTGLQRYVTVNYLNGTTIVANDPTPNAPVDHSDYANYLNIQPGQGFWVYHTAGTSAPTLVIKETNKVVGGVQTGVFGTSKVANILSASIWKDVDGVSTSIDGVVATFDNNYTNSIGSEDAKKLMNGAENISISESGNDLSIDGLALPTADDVIALKLGNVKANTAYQLQVDATQFAANGLQAFIKDAYLNTEVPASTVINFTPTTDVVTYKDRFSVVFKQSKVVPVVIGKGNISVFPNPLTEKSFKVQMTNIAGGKYNVVMVNNLGQEVSVTPITHVEGSTSETITMSKTLSSGVYTLVLKSAEGNGVYQTELLAR